MQNSSSNSNDSYNDSRMKGKEIEEKSMQIIEREIGKHPYNELEWLIVKRVIHSTADFDFAKKSGDTNANAIIFSKNAIGNALKAIASKCVIVGDTDIILAALNKSAINQLGLRCICNISDPLVAEQAGKVNKTRAEVAMRLSAEYINNGIVAIGNAPTALYELIRMIKEGIRPMLVIAVPVGFVSAVESKEALLGVDGIEYITNRGRKGGSTVAAAILNALFKIYITTAFTSLKNSVNES